MYTWTSRATMTEVRMKNLFRMHIHPTRMGAIADSEVKQFLSLKVVKDHIFFLIWIYLLYSLHRRLSFLFIITSWSASVARGILKIELKQQTYNLFSLWHPQGYPWEWTKSFIIKISTVLILFFKTETFASHNYFMDLCPFFIS